MYRLLRDEVEEVLRDALVERDLPTDDLGLEKPPDGVDAMLASSIAFRLAEVMGEAPPVVASELVSEIDLSSSTYIGEIGTQGPYLNVRASEAYYHDTLQAAGAVEYGQLEPTGTDIVIEHTSANPTGPVHVGRARNPIIGDALARILSLAGHDVDRHYYVNDAGRQMAVFTWAYERFEESDLDDLPSRDRVEYDLTRYYRKGNEFLEEAPPEAAEAAEAEITAILRGLETGDADTYERVSEVVDQVLSGMKECLGRLPAEFDEFVKETRFMRDSSTTTIAERLKATEQAVFEEQAWQLDLSEWGFEKQLVFLRSDGTSLYTTRDLAHHEWKFEHYDEAITVLGEDHKLQAAQLDAVLELLGNDTDRLRHVIYSYVNLPEGKMSTRRGTGVQLDDLLDEAITRAREEVEVRLDTRIRDDELTEQDIERIARQVGIGAVRYDIVAKQPAKSITFRWEEALDFESQSAPYLQYVHARCCGIIDEAGREPPSNPDVSELVDPAERELLEVIARFPAVIEEAAADLRPHRVGTYTRTFAETFNAFYRDCPVTAKEVPAERRAARLALVVAARHTIGNALYALGVEAPESM